MDCAGCPLRLMLIKGHRSVTRCEVPYENSGEPGKERSWGLARVGCLHLLEDQSSGGEIVLTQEDIKAKQRPMITNYRDANSYPQEKN